MELSPEAMDVPSVDVNEGDDEDDDHTTWQLRVSNQRITDNQIVLVMEVD